VWGKGEWKRDGRWKETKEKKKELFS